MSNAVFKLLETLERDKDRDAKLAAEKFRLINQNIKDEKERAYQESKLLLTQYKSLYVGQLDELEKLEDNFSAIYGLSPEYMTSGGKELTNILLSNKDASVDELINELKVIETRSNNLRDETRTFQGQALEVEDKISKDADILDPNEFNIFLKDKKDSLSLGPDNKPGTADDITGAELDRLVRGYTTKYNEYLSSDALKRIQAINAGEEFGVKTGSPKSNASKLVLNRLVYNSYTTSQLQELTGHVSRYSNLMHNAPETYMKDENYLKYKKAADTLQLIIGLEFASLFKPQSDIATLLQQSKSVIETPDTEKSMKITEYADTYFDMFRKMHTLAAGKSDKDRNINIDPNFDNYFYNLRDSYQVYVNLDDKQKEKHHILAGKYFGYDPRKYENFDEFYEKAKTNYSNYLLEPFIEDDIIMPSNEDDEEIENKYDKY